MQIRSVVVISLLMWRILWIMDDMRIDGHHGRPLILFALLIILIVRNCFDWSTAVYLASYFACTRYTYKISLSFFFF